MAMPGALRCGARGGDVRALCVFVHGRGQSPEMMETDVVDRLGAAHVAFHLPRAPRGSWYDARAVDPLDDPTRAQLSAALDHLSAEVAAIRADYPGRPLLLAGFSQGACLALEYLCRGDPPPAAAALLTGCRVGTAACVRPDRAPQGLPVYLTGGDDDPWIPVGAWAEAALALGRRGGALRADLFPGRGHEVAVAEIAMLRAMLADLVAGHAPALEAAR
ncbi:phospholipase/carboxylesterase [Gemmobacter megaterium]|uniref:Phospholipase/carboxylesterase n=1 Tax=Gemmobacter megaterium TaxID=1086013 RepID=A0A1N7LP91_9RHOB|nr:hypothetical protein [Gemmobacter megaterium]GGE11382.1 phospholipase/carboxylesterase [Gemmobacter megaterium]SIS75589.1 phospholipase/carboxylesterase [Gemmobacter megaterium]